MMSGIQSSSVMQPGRAEIIGAFLEDAGFGKAGVTFLPGDASFRRYARLTGGPRPALLMDAPPASEDIRPWLRLSGHLRSLGFAAPEVFAADPDAGLAVIEDFGDATFTRLLAAGADEGALYDLATDVLIALHRQPLARAVPADLPAYDDKRLLDEVQLLVEWFLPAISPADGARESPAGGMMADYTGLWRETLAPLRDSRPALVLRDYHVDNLMHLPDREGIARCGLLDFQDAVAGPAAYDLVSLVGDARRDVLPEIAARARRRYVAAFPDLDTESFDTACAILSAQRNAKIIGIFTRLARRDGKPRYLAHVPRVWRLLESDLAHPALKPIRPWFDRVVPGNLRRAPSLADPQQGGGR